MGYDLTIALRVSPFLNKKHICFESKYDLVKTCFDSLIRSLEGLSYKLIVILDGCPEHYEDIFKEKVGLNHLKIINTAGVGNSATFLLQISVLLDQTSSEYVYFAEDDYFYIDRIIEMLQFIRSNSFVDFISPYDHPDYYLKNGPHPYEMINVRYEKREWKNVMSATCTFLTSKKTLEETKKILSSYGRLSDHRMWYLITRKVPLTNFLGSLPRPPHFFTTLFLLYYFIRSRGRRIYSLWVPVPTIATHLQKSCLSPKVNWRSYLP